MRHTLLASLLILLTMAACGDSRSGTGDGDGGTGAGGAGGDGVGGNGPGGDGQGGFFGATSIFDIQSGRLAAGGEVVVRDVVVIAVSSVRQQDGTYAPQHFFVSEPEGGAFSGIYIRNGSAELVAPAPAIGDVVTITGTYVEQFGRSQIELLLLEKTGTGPMPTPTVVDPEEAMTGGVKAEDYEGVLVVVNDVKVTETPVMGSDGADHGAFRINAAARATGGLVVNDAFGLDYVRVLGDSFSSVVGIIDFSFEEFVLLPRANEDMTFTDGSHPGLTEAGDKTIFQIQDVTAEGHPRAPANVTVRAVVVTAAAGSRVWVQEVAGGPWSGIQVRLVDGASAPQAGELVDVAGAYNEYFDLSQIEEATITSVGQAPAPAAPAAVTPAQIRTGSADAEQWEGVLVEVTDVKNVEDPVNGTDGQDRGDFRLAAAAGGTIETGVVVGHIFRDDYAAGAVGDLFASVVGVLDYSFSEYRLETRGNDDLTFPDGTHPSVPDLGVVTIYDLQDEGSATYAGTNVIVTLENVVVTASDSPDFFVQETGGAQAFSGVMARLDATVVPALVAPAAGELVTIKGKAIEYFGKTQLVATEITVNGPGAIPTPAAVTAEGIATGGADAERYEGVLVVVNGVENTEDPVLGTDGQDRGDFRVGTAGAGAGGVIVGHAFFTDYEGALGDGFTSIAGVLDFSFDESRLEPRTNEDITLADGSHPGPGPAVTTTIPQIQDVTAAGHPTEGTGVTVEGVVVTAVAPAGFFAMDVAGGPFSGLYVKLGAGVTSPAAGDVVTVVGTYEEYFTRTQIFASAVTKSGTAAIPAAAVVTPAEISTGAANAEQWEGVLVIVEGVENTQDPVLGTDGTDRNDYRVDAAGGAGGVIVGHLFRTNYRGVVGDGFQSIAGVLDFSFDEFRLEPRSDEDITLADGTHPGLVTTTTTIFDVQNGAIAPNGAVVIEGAVVTAVTGNGNFFIQDPAGGARSGIYVFKPNAVTAGVAAGDLVTVEGTYTEYFDLSEITLSRVTVTGAGVMPTPQLLTVDDLRTGAATAEDWEGVLVEVRDVVVTEGPFLDGGQDRGGFKVDETDDGNTADDLVVDDLFTYAYEANRATGDSFSSIVGLLDYSFSQFRLMPRGDADLTQN